MHLFTKKLLINIENFGSLHKEGKKMVFEVWTDEFCTKTVQTRSMSKFTLDL